MYLLGFDVGGTKIEAALVKLDLEAQASAAQEFFSVQTSTGALGVLSIISRKRVPTERHLGYEQIIAKMASLAKDVCEMGSISPAQVTNIGIGLPGAVHPQLQTMLLGNTMVFIQKAVGKDLAAALDFKGKIVCANDANCFALAEARAGAGIEYFKETDKPVLSHTAIGVILGTGCGGGVIVNGQMLTGKHGGAGEIGHSVLYEGGHPCYCGKQGCAEQYLSGTGLEGAFSSRRYSQIEGDVNAIRIFELADSLDPVAVAVVKQYKRDLGKFLGKLATIFDPDYFVLGGGLSQQKMVYEGLSENVAGQSFLGFPVPVYRHRLGDSAGVLGAAILAEDSL